MVFSLCTTTVRTSSTNLKICVSTSQRIALRRRKLGDLISLAGFCRLFRVGVFFPFFFSSSLVFLSA